MSSPFDTPPPRRPGMFSTPTPTAPAGGAGGANLYPDLPPELRNPVTNYGSSSAFVTSEQQRSVPAPPAPAPSTVVAAAPAASASDNLTPIHRAAKTIAEALDAEKRYPQLDDIVSQGQSAEYEIAQAYAWEPFVRSNNYTIPDAIFEQYNRATSHTLMGLFAEIKQAWITVDNRLYLWDYETQSNFQGFEGQSNTITCVRLLKPKHGVFNEEVNWVLAIATSLEVFLLGVKATKNERGVTDVILYDTKMTVPVRGVNVTVIEGSKKSGRIFFGGKTDNDVYELTYQAEERWFQGRCQKTNHTNSSVSAFTPRLPSWASGPKDTEYVAQISIDDTRNLLYTLSSKSTIRIFHIRGNMELPCSLSHAFNSTLSNIRVMVGNTPLLGPDTPIVSISPVSALQARRTHLIAVTKSGCRLFMSAVSTDYGFGNPDTAPTSMQVIHIRYPPPGQVNSNVRKAKVFTPGYFFCFLENGPQYDELLLAAPDAAKIQTLADSGSSRLQLVEQGSKVTLDSRVEACELVNGQFAAQRTPQGFGNEVTTQFDLQSTEIAVLTNSGVHVIRRRRLIEVFDATLRYGSTSSSVGVEGEIRKFFETYGRAEGCASALAVACGASQDTPSQFASNITDVEVHELARKYFIEFGGKPRADNVYDTAALPSLDSIKLSGRAEGLTIYITRIVRSIWRAWIINTNKTSGGGLEYVSSVPVSKLKEIQERLVRLATFLHDNKSFILGLSGAESLMGASSKIEEVANLAEHRMLHSLVTLIENMIEGISFVLFLLEDKLTDIILSLEAEHRELIEIMTYGNLFATSQGENLAKELVTAIVNRNIAAGVSVDTIADALRRRCGSFCSADDVVVFKALEQVKKAKSETDPDLKHRLLRESLRLFEETAASLTMDNLTDMVHQFRNLDYYPGAVQLALVVAREADRGNLALQFLTEPPVVQNETSDAYMKRIQCYQLIFRVLEDLDRAHGRVPEMIDGVPTPTTRLRNDTWNLVYNSSDQLFHYQLYDWLFSLGESYAERLLEVDSPYVLGYLQYRGAASLEHCELLWQYHARRENVYQAALVLHELAVSEFQLSLEKRLEFFSRARGFCNSSYGTSKKKMNELSNQLQEELDVAAIQDELLKRLREDVRISTEKKNKLELALGKQILSLSELFNKYAQPYGYNDICLCIFQAADWRGSAEIKKSWEQLISAKHIGALESGDVQPFEIVADTVRRLGNRFQLSEYIFPPTDLVPLLEIYAYEHQRDIGPPGWVVDTFVEAGIQEETLLRVLEEMFWRDEVPFRGTARRRLLADAVYVTEKWWQRVVKRGGREGFRAESVSQTLTDMAASVPRGIEAERIDRLLADVRRRSGVGMI